MSGQDSWYNVQQPQYPHFTAQPQQQQQQQQRPPQHLPHQHPQLGHQYMQHASTSYHNGHPIGIAEPPYQAASYANQLARSQYAAGQSGGDPPSHASGANLQSMNGHFLSLQGMQQSSPTSSGAAAFSKRESIGHYPQNSAYQHFPGGEKPPSAASHLQRQSIDFTSLASPVQQRFYPNAAPSQQQQQQQHPFAQPFGSPSGNATPQHQLQRPRATASQHVYESPYAPSTGTRERLAMSQSPMSDVFQSGAPSMGRTFNMMAGLDTPTPNPPLRRISAQSYAEDHPNEFSSSPGHHPQASASSLQDHWSSVPNGNGQQHSPWQAAQSSLASWNSTTKPYPSMQPLPTQSHTASFPPRNLSVDSRNASHLPSNTAQRTSLSDATPASVHADSYPAPPSSGSSLDAAWRVPYSRSSGSAQAPHSAQSMAHSRHIPHLIEPGSPTLSVARRSSHASPLHAQPPLPSLSGPSGSSTLDAAMSANPNVAPKPCMAPSSASAPHPTTQPQAHAKPVKRTSKPQLAAGPPQATPGDPFRGVMPSSSSSSASSASGFATGGEGLPQYASPSQLFARPQAAAPSAAAFAAAFPPPSSAVSIDPLAMRRSEEPQTPPPPQHQMLSVQESPDPLNLLSPNGHFSLWQQPLGAPLPPQPFGTNGAAHHRLALQQYGPAMARAPATNGALAAKRKDSTSAEKPKRKRSKKLKEELPHQPPAPHPPAESLQSAALQTESAAVKPKALKLKKLVKKEPAASKYDDDDVSMMPGVTVEIPAFAPDMYDLSSTSSAMEPSQTTKKKKKKQRSRKSLSELVNQIVEDSDSGMDAEGSDWEGLEIIENYDPEPVPEGPKSLAKMSNGPVKSSQRKVPIAKLCGLIEDIFEADDSLPDRDSLHEKLPGQSLSPAADQFFEIIESPAVGGGDSRSVLVLRAAALQKLLKLIVMCSRPHTEIASISGKAPPATNPSLGTIPAADTIRLLAILERSTRLAENIDPFPSQANRGLASEPASPSKPKKGRKLDRRSKSTSKTPEPTPTSEHRDDEAKDQEANAAKDAGDDERDRTAASRDSDDELEKLNANFVVMDRAVLATECSLGMLTGDVLPKQILSEDHIRSSFDAVKACLDKVLLPFIEACSGSAATAPHPHLVSLIDVLSPQKARKKKVAAANGDEATSSIGVICRNTLSDLFAHLCSALYFVQRMVRMPSIALSDSIIISAVYIALGPFFVLEPESAGGGASTENAKAAARGRSALLSLGGANSMKTLRLPALNLLRSIFAKAPDQRQWMIEEILTSLSKLSDMKKNRRQYSLRNGRAIHSINALLLQLIQAASHGVASYARSTADRLSRAKDSQDEVDQANGVSDRDGGPERMQTLEVVIEAFNATSEPDTNDAREAEIAIWRRGLEGANASARSIAGYLMQRIGQNKVAKSSQEMSHAYVIESLIQDLLSALFLPEWPAAALMLSAFCRVFGSYLEDAKSHPDAKGVALEQLSLVAARLRQSQLQLQPVRDDKLSISANSPIGSTQENAVDGGHALSEPVEDTRIVKRSRSTTWDHLSMLRALRERDREAIQEFVRTYKFISHFLAKTGNEDMSTEGALEFLLVQAEGELATAWSKVEEDMVALSSSEDGDAAQVTKLQHFREELDLAMVTLSEFDAAASSASFDAFASDDQELAQASDLSERALIASSSMIAYPVLRDLLVEGLNHPLIANRSKALRGIDRIAQVDPDLLDEDSMRSAIEVRLRDSSNAVRDSAVALFGSYLLRKPQHIPKYYKQIAARILDTGLSVRKRMVRLLKSLHEATDDPKIRIDTCARIVRCINDEDTLVQDMAVLTIGEMWLEMGIDARRLYSRRRGSPMRSTPVATQPADAADAKESVQRDADGQFAAEGERALPTVEEPIEETEADKKVADTIEIIMAVADVIKERPSPLEEVFRRLFKDKSESEAAELHAKLQRLGDSMIDSLVESSGASSIDTVKRIRIVQLLVSTNPAILTISKAKLLLPYLKAAQTSEEVQIMDLLLRIFRSCLPHMPKTALAFADALEKSLRPLVNRPPPKAGLHLLQELIACYCAVIITHTHNFKLLIQTLKACFMRVQAMRQMALKGQKVEENKAWSTLMSLTASLCEHADFDDIRKKHPETTADIDALSKRPLIDVVSEALLDIHRTGSEAVRSVSLQNLGFIFRAHPTLMTRPSLTAMMDDIFASGSLQDRATLLKIILDFLSADALRRNPDNAVVTAGTGRRKPENPDAGSVDMTILVGNTETFADTGVGSAMMQRYSEDVLKATLEVSNPPLQRTAIDILRFTVLQGLSHPIQCVPYLVSLETLEDRKLRSRAMELHSHLASKHASLVQARFLDTARSAFRFQMQLGTAQTLRGFRVDNMPTAVLGAWYSLLRDRRATRLDFLKQIVKALDVNTASADCSMDEVLFARFMADNLATLDYKTMEELFVVIGELRSILAVSGMQVLHNMQPHLPQQGLLSSAAQTESTQDGMRTPPPPGTTVQGGDLISPFGMSRNPWLSGEWQLQLASDATPPVGGTIDPTQIFGYPQPVATTDAVPSQTDNPAPLARDDEQELADSKTQIDPITVAKMSIVSGTALLLRNHLKQLYGLSEARCAKFNPSKKQSAGADKPATMRALSDPMHAALDLSAMPFGLEEVKSEEDARKQMVAYAAMVENEGTMMEPEDADGLDDLAL